jgi:CDP-diacylglycerol---glycerol-3-phosphate 3-phosphatidyltransferase
LRSFVRRPVASRILVRRLSTSPNPATGTSAVVAHPLVGATTQFDHVAPRFEIAPSEISILDSPSAFYETLKHKIRNARKRIYLSTLYIGKTETELINTINEALADNPDLEVSILTDALRGTRESPEPSCASLLASLVAAHGNRVKISMFHTPNLTGWRKRVLPRRINEGWGLQHMKLYCFDDEIMLSGANLSNDYFTNRLDRYHIFSSKALTHFYARIHDAVCELSYNVVPSNAKPDGYILESPMHRGIPDPVWHPARFKKYAKQILEPLIHVPAKQRMFPVPFTTEKTFVYPVAQFDILLGEPKNVGFLDYEFAAYTSTEKPILTKLLTSLSEKDGLKKSSWVFTAGYFNIDPDIAEALIAAAPGRRQVEKQEQAPCTVITASPWANGFYGSAGISGMLPAAYTLLSRRFLREVSKAGKDSSVELKEWRRGTVGEADGWTYHAKGLWVTLPPQFDAEKQPLEEPGPSVTLVGSSNYTKRSYSLDLEIGALIVTGDDKLKRRLKEETEWLQKDAKVTTQDDLMKVDRRVGLKVRAAMWLVGKLGGAL